MTSVIMETSEIALNGQAAVQLPQEMHLLMSMDAFLSGPMEMAPAGQPFSQGRWAVAAADAAADVTVTCRQGELTSLLMGSCDLEGLLRLGAAGADDPDGARELARLLHCSQKPWLNADY